MHFQATSGGRVLMGSGISLNDLKPRIVLVIDCFGTARLEGIGSMGESVGNFRIGLSSRTTNGDMSISFTLKTETMLVMFAPIVKV